MPESPAADRTRWDLSNVYSSLNGQDYLAAMQQWERELAALGQLFDEHDVRRLEAPPAIAAATLAQAVEVVLRRVNEVVRLGDTLESFVYAFVSTDSYDATAAREMSRVDLLQTQRKKLAVRLQGWIGSLAPRLEDLLKSSALLKEHEFFLRDTVLQSKYLMSEPLEELAAELCLDSGVAFGKLQGNVTSQLKVPFERDGHTEMLPITVIRNFSFDPDPTVRERAYRVEQTGWESIRTTVAACLNGVKGTAQTLAHRRQRASVLDWAVDQNRIDRETLDALLGAIREYFPVFRRYLRSKAQKLGKEQLPWWDLFAPLGRAEHKFTWDEARSFIIEKFSSFSADMGELAKTAFDSRWIDGLPRDGKRGGAFCMAVVGVEESRILANFDGSFEQTSTLAHELGHAYHNWRQKGLLPLRRGSPSTLAETASIFCETLIAEAALADASPEEQLLILETQLAGATQVCVDISSRFLFESAVFERRTQGELSPDDFCTLMRTAQAETYGDAVVPETYHPYMWLWKPHYYAYDGNFYNFPYAFGHLFGLGLYAIYRREGQSFVPRYEELLRSTELDYAAPLARRFGLEITQREFWRQSLQVIERQVERFEAL